VKSGIIKTVPAEHLRQFQTHLLSGLISELSVFEAFGSAGEGGRMGPSLDAVDTGVT